MKKKKYRVVWRIELDREVEAKNVDEVLTEVENIDCQYDGSYVTDSFEVVKVEEVKK